jgi:hypothetical protein
MCREERALSKSQALLQGADQCLAQLLKLRLARFADEAQLDGNVAIDLWHAHPGLLKGSRPAALL